MSPTIHNPCDIAIIGMSCMFPGADSPSLFWENIIGKVDCIGDAPDDWQPDYFYDPSGSDPDRSYTRKGGFLGDLCRFDPVKYGVTPNSIDGSEPDHFIALRCAYEALADAGFPDIPINREKTGVVIGRGLFVNRGWVTVFQRTVTVDQIMEVLRKLEPDRSEPDLKKLRSELMNLLPPTNADTFPGLVHSALVGRIANRLDLNGPAYTVDAACASALLATELAIRELHSGTCDAVIVGGCQVSIPAPIHILFCHLGALSRSGKIAPFSADANGTLLGQGCGMLVLKRRADAERDGNRIYALIKGVGTSSDGKGTGLLAPRTEGQQLAIRRAYEHSGLQPATVSLIEAHGTGIAMGDATEIESLKAIFDSGELSPGSIAIGSVKSMLGHLIPASGVASLIKTALALYHRVLPPTLHAEEVHPHLRLEKTPFYVCNEPRPWLNADHDTPRRAGIDAFGFGGANAHAVLEEYCCTGITDSECLEVSWPAELVVISAPDRVALRGKAQRLGRWLSESKGVRLLDIAASCALEQDRCTLAIVAKNCEELERKLAHAEKLLGDQTRTRIQDRNGIYWYNEPLARTGRVAFMFPGEGSQYANMHAELCRQFPEVRHQFDLTATGFARHRDRNALSRILFPQPGQKKSSEDALFQMDVAVAVVTAAARGLLDLLTRFGLAPDAVIGHSSGEFAACLAAGAFCPAAEEELLRSIINGVASTAKVAGSNAVPSVMLLSVGGAEPGAVEKVIADAEGRITVAMDNCPNQKILLGDEASMHRAWNELRGKGGLCERLPWNRPYHSDAFKPACAAIEEYIQSLKLQTPNVDFWSCATAQKFPAGIHEIASLMVQQWHSPVRFRETVEAMYEDGIRLFIEVGPRANLCSFVTDTLAQKPHLAVPMDVHTKHGLEQLCRALGMLVAQGVPVKLNELYKARKPKTLNFQHPAPAQPELEPILRLALPLIDVPGEVAQQYRRPRLAPETGRISKESPQPETAVPPSRTSPRSTSPGESGKVLKIARAGKEIGQATKPAKVDRAFQGPNLEVEWKQPVYASSARQQSLVEFQRTMRQFLKLQQSVLAMRARQIPAASNSGIHDPLDHVEEQLTAGHFNPGIDSASLVQRSRSNLAVNNGDYAPAPETPPATTARSTARTTFLDSILEYEAGRYVVAECELDVSRHRFLLDHTFFGRGLSSHEPEITPLPVTPLAVTLELMAEAAVQLHPECSVRALSDIRISRWLAMFTNTRRVRMVARASDDGTVQVAILEADREGMNAEIAHATIELSDEPRELGSQRLPDPVLHPPPWTKDQLYGKVLFHGPAFRAIDEVTHWSPTCVAVRLRAVLQELVPGQALTIPVQLIDNASQIPGLIHGNYWEDEGPVCKLAFPNHVERVEMAIPFPHDLPLSAVAVIEENSTVLRSHTEFKTTDGRVVMRYWGKTEEIVLFPRCIYEYTFNPDRIWCSEDITELFAGVPGLHQCAISKTRDGGYQLLVHRLWSQIIARIMLNGSERRVFNSLNSTPVAIARWLSGRIAAKDSVRLLYRLNCAMADIRIESNDLGRPSAQFGDQGSSLLSLSHKEFSAVAVAAGPNDLHGVGIDLEPALPLDATLVEEIYHKDEVAIITNSCLGSRVSSDLWFRAGWCAKEAIGKALGQGLPGGSGNVRIISLNIETGCFRAVPVGPLASLAQCLAGGVGETNPVEAWCRFHDDRIIGLCLLS
ncbi:MAG: beta-ketoacyl synthase N-terminal-like domain-containing protein [Methylococcales bacterium]